MSAHFQVEKDLQNKSVCIAQHFLDRQMFAGAVKSPFIALLLMSMPSVALAQGDQDWKSCNAEDAEMAIPACTRLIATEKLDPKGRSAALSSRASAHWRKHDYDRAIADADKAIEFNPKNSDAYLRRGAAYAGKGDHDRAFADESKAIELDPKNFKAYHNRGLIYAGREDYDRAIVDATKAIELNPEFAVAYVNRASSYLRKGDFDRAIDDATKAIEINPKLASAYDNRSNAYMRKGDFDRTIADATKAIEVGPEKAPVYQSRGAAYANKGDYDLAIADYEKLAELQPKNIWAINTLGLLRFAKGDFAGASADLLHVLELRDDVYAMLFRYLARAHIGEGEAAIVELAANAERMKVKVWPSTFIELYLGKRSPDAMLAAGVKRSDRCMAQFYVGEWYALKKNSEQATAALSAAVEVCSKDSVEYRAASAELARLKP